MGYKRKKWIDDEMREREREILVLMDRYHGVI